MLTHGSVRLNKIKTMTKKCSNKKLDPLLPHSVVVTTSTEEETLDLGSHIAEWLKKIPPQPIALIGELGAGKTTLAKGIIHGLTGISIHEITSPTFQYASLFEGSPDGLHSYSIAHCDLWRMADSEEFLNLGLEDLLTNHYCLIEWPDRIASLLPKETLEIHAEWADATKRTYIYFN